MCSRRSHSHNNTQRCAVCVCECDPLPEALLGFQPSHTSRYITSLTLKQLAVSYNQTTVLLDQGWGLCKVHTTPNADTCQRQEPCEAIASLCVCVYNQIIPTRYQYDLHIQPNFACATSPHRTRFITLCGCLLCPSKQQQTTTFDHHSSRV